MIKRSSKPYLIRALYEWIADNDCTPYIVVNATKKNITVPQQYIESGKIILNIAMRAVRHLDLGMEAISFQARFNGQVEDIFVPVYAVEAIYAKETGQGMTFEEESEDAYQVSEAPKDEEKPSSPPKGKPFLTIVK